MIHIMMATEERYVMPTRVALFSLIENTDKEEYEVYVIHSNLSYELVSSIESMSTEYVRIKCVTFEDDMLGNMPYDKRYTVETYYRLFGDRILPSHVKKVIWIDGDVIINGSLADLYNTNMEEYYFAGYLDSTLVGREQWMLDHMCNEIGLSEKDIYINAGIIVINVENLRNHATYDKEIIDFIMQYKYLCCHDQDIINGVYGRKGKIKVLADKYKYNFPVKLHSGSNLKKYKIIHYLGNEKPWLYKGGRASILWWDVAMKIGYMPSSNYASLKRLFLSSEINDITMRFCTTIYRHFVPKCIRPALKSVLKWVKNLRQG